MARLVSLCALLVLASCVTNRVPGSLPTRSSMHAYALLFRRSSPIDPATLPSRNAAARAWALELERRGVLQTAAPLEDDGRLVRATGIGPLEASEPVASVLVIEAESLDAATRLVADHPGLAFGVTIEVRPLKAVTPSTR